MNFIISPYYFARALRWSIRLAEGDSPFSLDITYQGCRSICPDVTMSNASCP